MPETNGPVIPEPTDADRAAAFPDVGGHHHRMDTPFLLFALLDQFEWVDAERGPTFRWEGTAWFGNDEHRLWLRTEGEQAEGSTEAAELHLLYGRPIARWWDLVAGLRHDFKPRSAQTWLALGVQGLAPYWFETEATAYLGEDGQSSLRIELEYELLLTNRLILQPLVEFNLYSQNDPERARGSGLATTEVGLRLRYQIRREIAPYIGVTWEQAHGATSKYARLERGTSSDLALLAGVRLWY
jgi:copper resistance protein B